MIDFLTKQVQEQKKEEESIVQTIEEATTGLSGEGGQTQKIKAEMEAQMAILKMESELEKARKRLLGMRKSRYNK